MAYAIPPRPDHLTLELVAVTPEMAARYLRTMHSNRVTSKLDVSVMEANLREGTFYPDISPVFIDGGDPALELDRAWDGKHRFEAIVNTRVPAWLLFVRGVTEEASRYADTGRKRTFADSLKIEGVQDYRRQAVLARYMALYTHYGMEAIQQPNRYAVTQDNKHDWVAAPGIIEASHIGAGMYRALKANEHTVAFAAYVSGGGREAYEAGKPLDPDGFWAKVRSGEGKIGEPSFTLHNWLLGGQRRERTPADKRLMTMYAVFTAWNKHLTGEPYSKIQPTFVKRLDGTLYFPSSSVPDIIPAGGSDKSLAMLKEAFAEIKAHGHRTRR